MTGWIEHKGDGIPTLKNVDIRYRGGDEAENVTPKPGSAIWNWRGDPHPDENDIVAYRIREEKESVTSKQVGGNHYAKLGDYQPWEVLRRWLTPEEFRGYLKGEAIVYLARERDKGGLTDIEKSAHVLQALVEFAKNEKG